MSWLTEYQEGRAKVNAVIWYLEKLSDLLYQVGNDKLHESTLRMYNDLTNALKQIDKAVMGNLNAQYKQAQESSANVLKACLAGVKLAENEKETETDT